MINNKKINIFFKYLKKNIFYIILIILIIFSIYYFFYLNEDKKEHFSENIPIYIINLDRSQDRWFNMKKQCIGLNCNRIKAIDGKTLDESEYKNILKTNNMKKNTIACFMSHLKCLKKFINSNDEYVIILEDDVNIVNDFNKKLKNIKKEIEEQDEKIDLIFLGGTRVCGTKFSKSLLKTKQTNKDCNAGTFGYMLSKEGAKKVYDKFNNDGILKMFDHQLRDYFSFLNVLSCNPPLIIHDFDQKSVRINRKYNNNYIKNAQSIKVN